MKILGALIDSLPDQETPVRGICAGARWTVVTTRGTGMSTTYRDPDLQGGHDSRGIPDAGQLLGQPARALLAHARSTDTLAASIGMATVNSLLDVDEARCTPRGAFDILAERGRGRNVAVVGHFPFVPKLREHARHVWVIEKQPRPGDFPERQAARILPRCEVVCLTGTAFINHTLEDLLALCRDSYVVLTGPTSPLSPVLFEFGIDAICGTRVVDADEVTRFVSQAATFQQIHGHGVRLLTLTRETRRRP